MLDMMASLRRIKPVMKIACNLTAAEKVEAAIKAVGYMTANEIMNYTGLLSGTVYRALAKLEVCNSITRSQDSGVTGNSVKFSLVA